MLKKNENFVDSLCFSVPLSLNRQRRRGRREHRDRPGLVPGHQVAKLPVKWGRKSVRFRPFLSQHSTCRCKWPADQSPSSILQPVYRLLTWDVLLSSQYRFRAEPLVWSLQLHCSGRTCRELVCFGARTVRKLWHLVVNRHHILPSYL